MSTINRRSCAALAYLSIGARMLFAVQIDSPELLNAGWISVILSGILTLPVVLCMDYIERVRHTSAVDHLSSVWGRIYCAVVALFMVYETGNGISILASSASYMSLTDTLHPVLICVCALVCVLGCTAGVQAVAGTAIISARLLGAVIVIAFLIQLNSFNIRWMTPVLGPGLPTITSFVPGLCGMMTTFIPIWLLKEHDETKPNPLTKMLVVTVVLLVALVVLFGMLMPPMQSGPISRLFNLDRLLSNGRTPQTLQILTVPIWYLTLVISICFMLLGATHALLITFPKLNRVVAILVLIVIAICVPFLNLGVRPLVRLINTIRWPVLTLPILVYALVCGISARKEAKK